MILAGKGMTKIILPLYFPFEPCKSLTGKDSYGFKGAGGALVSAFEASNYDPTHKNSL
jgi:hypothetical protein